MVSRATEEGVATTAVAGSIGSGLITSGGAGGCDELVASAGGGGGGDGAAPVTGVVEAEAEAEAAPALTLAAVGLALPVVSASRADLRASDECARDAACFGVGCGRGGRPGSRPTDCGVRSAPPRRFDRGGGSVVAVALAAAAADPLNPTPNICCRYAICDVVLSRPPVGGRGDANHNRSCAAFSEAAVSSFCAASSNTRHKSSTKPLSI